MQDPARADGSCDAPGPIPPAAGLPHASNGQVVPPSAVPAPRPDEHQPAPPPAAGHQPLEARRQPDDQPIDSHAAGPQPVHNQPADTQTANNHTANNQTANNQIANNRPAQPSNLRPSAARPQPAPAVSGPSRQLEAPALRAPGGPAQAARATAAHQKSAEPAGVGRRLRLPAILFGCTCLTTFWAGATGGDLLTALSEPASVLSQNWLTGLAYMAAVMGILLAHELGHFLQAVRYRIPVSLPYFIPMPLWRIGTMGAFIAMRGFKANRRELFDIGLTGPWAGLAVALPLAFFGMRSAEAIPPGVDGQFGNPLLFQLLAGWLRDGDPTGWELIHAGNPMLMAGWVGMLVTGLNMLPIGQLDGGHVAYTMLGRRAHLLAWLMAAAAVTYIILAEQYGWSLMLGILLLMGVRHPPTADDTTPLGWQRYLLGAVSLAIPIFCLTPVPFRI